MNRKSDKNNHPWMDTAPEEWYEPSRVVSPSKQGGEEVVIKMKSSEEISKEQLDPSLFNLTDMIENGALITPSGDVTKVLNASDVADVQAEADYQANEIIDNYNKNEKS